MPITKQRILQAGVVALAMTMLGGYVVYSQRAQQPQQIAQSSKGRIGGLVPSGLVEGTNTRGTNLTMPGASMVFLNAAGRPVSTSTVPVAVITTGNVSKVMMGGSKSIAVVQEGHLRQVAAPATGSNPASRVMMPSSKLIVLSRPAGATISTVTNTNVVSQPVPAK